MLVVLLTSCDLVLWKILTLLVSSVVLYYYNNKYAQHTSKINVPVQILYQVHHLLRATGLLFSLRCFVWANRPDNKPGTRKSYITCSNNNKNNNTIFVNNDHEQAKWTQTLHSSHHRSNKINHNYYSIHLAEQKSANFFHLISTEYEVQQER